MVVAGPQLPPRRAGAAGATTVNPPTSSASTKAPSGSLSVKGRSMNPPPAGARPTGSHPASTRISVKNVAVHTKTLDPKPSLPSHHTSTRAARSGKEEGLARVSSPARSNQQRYAAAETSAAAAAAVPATPQEHSDSLSAAWHSSCNSTPISASSAPPSTDNTSSCPGSEVSEFHPRLPPQRFPPTMSESGASHFTPSSAASEPPSTPQSTVTHTHTGFSTRQHPVRDWNDGLSGSSVGDVSIDERRLVLASPVDTVSSAPDGSTWFRQAEGDVLGDGSPRKLLFQQGAGGRGPHRRCVCRR
ncbi:MAG: hypothetical protein WDW36_002327 [Sanguina aurantia]